MHRKTFIVSRQDCVLLLFFFEHPTSCTRYKVSAANSFWSLSSFSFWLYFSKESLGFLQVSSLGCDQRSKWCLVYIFHCVCDSFEKFSIEETEREKSDTIRWAIILLWYLLMQDIAAHTFNISKSLCLSLVRLFIFSKAFSIVLSYLLQHSFFLFIPFIFVPWSIY